MFRFDMSNLRGDFYGGLTSGVVALPLALAFGEASGAGPMAGVYGAIIVGFFASLFGGTGSNVSGPTGPMIVVFAGVFASLSGDLGLIFATVVLAGVLQIVFGVLKFGQYIRLVPYPVVSGFMSGIGCIIIALQTARLFGHEPESGGTVPALLEIPGAVMDPNLSAFALGALTLAIVFMWPKTWGRLLPAPLAALLIGTVAGLGLSAAPVLGEVPTGLPAFIMPNFSTDAAFVIFEAAIILALLGSIDSLLTSLVADNMTRTRHDSNKELIGQGIGNMAAGFFGGIPGAGATMRTVANIRTGGLTRLSGMFHSVLLLSVIVVLAPIAALIPHAVLAGILVKVGYDIIDVGYLKRAHQGPRWDLLLMVIVLGLTVFVDLITAVAAGVVLASLAFVKQMADAQLKNFGGELPRIPYDLSTEEDALLERVKKDHVTMFDFGGPLSFGAAADLGHHVRERVKKNDAAALVLDFTRVPFVDVSAARAVETITSDAEHVGKRVFISGMNDQVKDVLAGLNDNHSLLKDSYFSRRVDAIRAAVEYCESTSNQAEAPVHPPSDLVSMQ
jgi:SulP family sulfate permease